MLRYEVSDYFDFLESVKEKVGVVWLVRKFGIETFRMLSGSYLYAAFGFKNC